MNKTYSNTVLYAYPVLKNLIEQMDKSVLKKALGSMDDFSPALCQCEAVIDVMYQKQLVYDLLFKTEDILKKFTEEELKHFEYKYFRRKPKTYFLGFDTASRKYFRKQVSLSNRFAALLEKRGITDEVFIKEYLKIDFFRELLVRVKEREENSVKNRPKKREN